MAAARTKTKRRPGKPSPAEVLRAKRNAARRAAYAEAKRLEAVRKAKAAKAAKARRIAKKRALEAAEAKRLARNEAARRRRAAAKTPPPEKPKRPRPKPHWTERAEIGIEQALRAKEDQDAARTVEKKFAAAASRARAKEKKAIREGLAALRRPPPKTGGDGRLQAKAMNRWMGQFVDQLTHGPDARPAHFRVHRYPSGIVHAEIRTDLARPERKPGTMIFVLSRLAEQAAKESRSGRLGQDWYGSFALVFRDGTFGRASGHRRYRGLQQVGTFYRPLDDAMQSALSAVEIARRIFKGKKIRPIGLILRAGWAPDGNALRFRR